MDRLFSETCGTLKKPSRKKLQEEVRRQKALIKKLLPKRMGGLPLEVMGSQARYDRIGYLRGVLTQIQDAHDKNKNQIDVDLESCDQYWNGSRANQAEERDDIIPFLQCLGLHVYRYDNNMDDEEKCPMKVAWNREDDPRVPNVEVCFKMNVCGGAYTHFQPIVRNTDMDELD